MGKPVKHANDDVYIGSKSLLKSLIFMIMRAKRAKLLFKFSFEICKAAILAVLARKFKNI